MESEHLKSTIAHCNLLEFDSSEPTNFLEAIPFQTNRIFYITQVPPKHQRGNHAHINCKEVIVAINGSFIVSVFDGTREMDFLLSDPFVGLYIPSGIWVTLTEFEPESVCLVLASNRHDSDDYILDMKSFVKMKDIGKAE